MQYGLHCEECEEAIWVATTRAELAWLRNREHVVREVAAHVSNGLDSWMMEALEFLRDHSGHGILIAQRHAR